MTDAELKALAAKIRERKGVNRRTTEIETRVLEELISRAIANAKPKVTP